MAKKKRSNAKIRAKAKEKRARQARANARAKPEKVKPKRPFGAPREWAEDWYCVALRVCYISLSAETARHHRIVEIRLHSYTYDTPEGRFFCLMPIPEDRKLLRAHGKRIPYKHPIPVGRVKWDRHTLTPREPMHGDHAMRARHDL